MKKIFLPLLITCFLINAACAVMFIGAREAGMAGCGASVSTGLSSVAYNPAGFMRGPDFEFDFSIGYAATGIETITSAYSDSTDLSQFLTSNVSNEINANGAASIIMGFNINKVGVTSVIDGNNSLNNSIVFDVDTAFGF